MCPSSGGSVAVQIYRYTTAERNHLTYELIGDCYTVPTPPTVKLGGTIDSASRAPNIRVSYGGSYDAVQPNGNVYAMDVAVGTHDLIAVNWNTVDRVADLALVQRGVTVSADTKHDIDFLDARPLVRAPISGVPASAQIASYLYLADGSWIGLGTASVSLADTEAAKGDLYDLHIDDYVNGVGIEKVVATVEPFAYVPPAPLGAITSAITATKPYLHIASTWPVYAGATSYIWFAAQQDPFITWSATMSPAIVGAEPSFEMPDFTTVDGFDESFAFRQDALHHTIDADAMAIVSTRDNDDCPDWACTPGPLGTTRSYASSWVDLTP